MSKVLIVGGDSFLSKELAPELSRRGFVVTCSTKNSVDKKKGFIYLDLLKPESFPKKKFDVVILLAGIWGYQECAKNPVAKKVNIDNMAILAKQLCQQGAFVSFISSNTVFGGEAPWCNEYAQHTPKFPYAEHKSLSEKKIKESICDIKKENNFNIIRLTKILGPETSPLPEWLDALENKRPLTPFADLIFAPISVQYAAKHVADISTSRLPGAFHLSGKDNLNYHQLSTLLCETLNKDQNFITPTTSVKCGVSIPFLPKYSGLGMKHTTNSLGIIPQSIHSVIADIIKARKN